jgi:aspartyl-tRNA(Asn)/glutamyl-tRNA(Gln) amidotransferase subunit A
MSLASSTIASLRQRLLAKEISPRDIVSDVAQAIEKQNASIGAYLSWDLEKAFAEA